jgi:ankyrin repeat protein
MAAQAMAATAAVQKTTRQTVLDVLGLMVGADLVRAMETAFVTKDFTSLQSTLPALGSAGMRALHQPAFEAACEQGRADVAQVLLASDSVNAAAAVTTLGETRTLLQHAIHNNCPDVVRVLLTDASAEATINADLVEDEGEWGINAPLLLAAGLGRVECLQALLACAHVDIHAVGHGAEGLPVTPLGFAAQNGHLCCVRALLAADGIGVNCMAQDENGDTTMSALMAAAYTDQVPCLLALLDADGVNVNLQGDNGWTALTFACYSGSQSAAEALLAVEGIDASLADSDDGDTPLHYAAINDMFHTVQLLLKRKEVNASAATTNGVTPLHDACWGNHPGMVRALLLGGGCRFKLTTNTFYLRRGTAGDGTPLGITTNANVRTVFASDIDYWQRKHHAHHSWAMKEVVLTLLLVAQRMGAHADTTQPLTLSSDAHPPVQHQPRSLPLLPEEIWLELLGFLRSADSRA